MENLSQNFVVNLNPQYGLISISGPDALTFLQGQLTCDMTTVSPGATVLGAFCNPKGRVRAIFRIFIRADRYFLYLPLSILPQTLESIQKYARFSKVTLQDESANWACWGIVGLNRDTLDSIKDNPDISILTLSASRAVLIGSAERLSALIENETIQQSISLLSEEQHTGFDIWKSLDIENLIPEIWPETVERFLPHDIGLVDLGAVSFKKGCYCGQEIIARMEYRGKMKKYLFRKTFDITDFLNIPSTPGTELEDGIIVSSCLLHNKIEVLLQATEL